MLNSTELSEAKRALLEKFLRGNLPKTPIPASAIARQPAGGPKPLSFGQQQLWLLAQLIGDSPVYNECVTVRLPGPLDVAALEYSFNTLLERHEAWRTCFPLVDGHPVQVVQPELTFALPVVDLRYLPSAERQAEALRRAKAEALPAFDLAHGPLLRATLMQLDDEEHLLFLTLHHIIFDGVTIYQVFLPELRTLYEDYLSGQPSSLPELPIQYTDFTVWQRDWLQGELFREQLAYWKKQLAGAPALLELPTDHPRPAVPSYRGSMRYLALGKRLTDDLRALSRQEGCTLYALLQAALNVLLYRYTGQDDILIGTATSGRTHIEVQHLMGIFINMLVMRTKLAGNPSFRELLARTREVTLEAQTHQDVPFEYVVKELSPEREQGQNPFFQVMLMLEPAVPTLPSGWTLTHMDINTDTSKFDLSLIIEDRPEGLVGWFEYSTDLFNDATIERMMGHWVTLLEGIIADPTQYIAHLPLLTQAERRQQLVEWNDTATDYPHDTCMHQLFDAQAARTPNDIAAVCAGEQLTYRELQRKSNQLAHRLQALGVGPEVLVGVCMERSLDMLVALLGILKAGGAYVPLDPAYPQERLDFMLQDSQASVLLTQRRLSEHLPKQAAKVICLDTDWHSIARESDQQPISQARQTNLAYVIYTSGSTGRPKGVAITHHSAVVFIDWALGVFPTEDLAGVLASTSICFDLSVFEIFVPLSCGGTVIVVENVLHLPDLPRSTQVTLINSVPSAVTELLRSHRLPASVRTVNLAGEALPGTLVQRLYQQDTVQRVFNLYGPSEDTTYSTYMLVEKGSHEPTIGRPITNTQAYILDTFLQPVPIGVAGEIYLGGEGLARGYLNRPELTEERFIVDPFNPHPGARLYKTGDLARHLPDGTIEFLGRLDHQVKLRGFRIEIGEIEELLRQHPAVRDVVVVVREDTPGDKRLVAYVAADQEQPALVNTLRNYLQEKLPRHMIPAVFILLTALPRTPNGKIDRRALPTPSVNRRVVDENFEAPLLTVHHQLTQIWEELLNVHPIGIKDNFFSLGGHSLLAARLFDKIEQIFGKKLPLATFYAGATIEHLADVIMGEQNAYSRTPLVAVQVGGDKRPFFFLHGDWAGGGFYCLNLARDLGADQPFYVLEPYKFEGLQIPPSFEAMAAAHIEALRGLQPSGPYLLGGFCNGGLMAYEIARQLHAQGEQVDLLALIDPATPAPHKSIRKAIGIVGKLLHRGEGWQLDWFLRYIYLRIPSYRKKVQNSMAPAVDDQVQPAQKRGKMHIIPERFNVFAPTSEALRHQWSGIYRWVVSTYMPALYPGKVTFLWSTQAFRENADWRKVAEAKPEDVETHVFPGSHVSCKTDNLHIVVKRLNECLDKVQENVAVK